MASGRTRACILARSPSVSGFLSELPSDITGTSCIEVQFQPWPRPTTLVERAGRRPGHPGIAHVGSAETDIGDHRIGERVMLDTTVRREHRDAPVQQRADAHV